MADDNDLTVLHPEQQIEISGETVTVREYGFVEGLRLQARIKPIIDGLDAAAGEDGPGLDALDAIMAEHADRVLELVAQAADKPLDWVESLSDEHGQQLLMTWWAVNARFFLRRLMLRRAMDQARHPDGAPSTPPSSTTATHGTPSDATPSAK